MTPSDIETERLTQQVALDAERTQAERNALGQFATPPALAEQIAAAALALLPRGVPVRFLDPTIGSGSFYSALLRTHGTRPIEAALGVEIDPRFATACATLWGPQGLEVLEGDFTQQEPPPPAERATLVLANPPYVRHHHLDAATKLRLRARSHELVGGAVSGLAGLYVHALIHSLPWMAPGGVAAWLIPSEWMGVNYGEVLRRVLTSQVRLHRVHVFDPGDVQFGDALVSSSVVFFSHGAPDPSQPVVLSFGRLDAPAATATASLAELRTSSKWMRLLPSPKAASKPVGAAGAQEGGATIGSLLRIRRGLATGNNGLFIRPRSAFLAAGVPPQFLKPILPPARALKGDRIAASPDGWPVGPDPLALLDCPFPETIVERDYPGLWALLQTPDYQAAKTSYLCSHRSPWYSQERRPAALFVSTYMGRSRDENITPFRVLWNQSQATATNGYLLLYPQGDLERVLEADQAFGADVQRLLNAAVGQWYAHHGRVYGGGLHKLEPKELAAIPAPELAAEIARRLAALPPSPEGLPSLFG